MRAFYPACRRALGQGDTGYLFEPETVTGLALA
jgi:hypothetical protein